MLLPVSFCIVMVPVLPQDMNGRAVGWAAVYVGFVTETGLDVASEDSSD